MAKHQTDPFMFKPKNATSTSREEINTGARTVRDRVLLYKQNITVAIEVEANMWKAYITSKPIEVDILKKLVLCNSSNK